MAQHDYDLANATGASFRSDANAALAAIVTLNSGANEPTTRYAYQFWADTTTGLIKQRNAANSAWITIGTMASTNWGLVPSAGGTQAQSLGSAGAPSYSFTGDTNTGMWSPGADIIGFSTGGTERVRISAAGYLKAANNGLYESGTNSEHELTNSSATNPVVRMTALNVLYGNNVLQIYATRNTTNNSYKAIDYFNIGSGSVRFAVFDSGQILSVGSYNNTTASAANVFIDASGGFLRSTSSGDYKTDVQDVSQEAANAVLGLRPIRYRSIADADNPSWSWYGLIAEEVAAVDPRLVHWGYRESDYEVVTEEYQELVETPEYNAETGEVTLATSIVTKERNARRLREDAQLHPEGVQYERVAVLLLAQVQALEARIAALESA